MTWICAWIALPCLLLVALAPVQSGAEGDDVEGYIRDRMAGRQIPGLSLAVARDGGVILARGYGLASEAGGPGEASGVDATNLRSGIMRTRRVLVMFTCGLAIFAGRTSRGGDKDARQDPGSRFPILSGIGCALSVTDAGPQIGRIVPGSVAEKSGRLKEGDLILSIRDAGRTVDLKGKPMGDVVSLIRGPVGSTITLEIAPKDGGPSYLVRLKREAVPLPGISVKSTYDELIGKPGPTARFSTLDRSAQVALADYAGQVVVIDFWASWCGTCFAPVDRMQGLARAHPEWKGRVALVAATIDTDLSAAARVVEARGWKETTHLALPPGELEAMKIVNVPAVIIISPDGKIAAAGDPHSISIEEEVSRLLRPIAAEGRTR